MLLRSRIKLSGPACSKPALSPSIASTRLRAIAPFVSRRSVCLLRQPSVAARKGLVRHREYELIASSKYCFSASVDKTHDSRKRTSSVVHGVGSIIWSGEEYHLNGGYMYKIPQSMTEQFANRYGIKIIQKLTKKSDRIADSVCTVYVLCIHTVYHFR